MQRKNSSTDVELSVCIITYNHFSYIERAINSVISQKTNFKFQIIIADDASTDGTQSLLLNFKEKFPEIITIIQQKKNIGAAKNWLKLIQTPKTKYIAYLEGDDYWIDSQKLQKQFDILETNLDYSLCFHDVIIINNRNMKKTTFPKVRERIFSTSDVIIRSWFCPSSSIIFRSEITKAIPSNVEDFPNGDILILFLASEKGKLIRIAECMGCYNYLSNNSMSSRQEGKKRTLKKLKNISRTLSNLKKISKKNISLYIIIKKLRILIIYFKTTITLKSRYTNHKH